MRTRKLFGKTVTEYETPLTVTIKAVSGKTVVEHVSGYTPEHAESKALAKFRIQYPDETVNSIQTALK